MVQIVVILGALFDLAFALGPPPCGEHEVELFPALCGKTEHRGPIGKATGSYCAPRCNVTEPCPKVKGINAFCSMTQQHSQHYCEYHCAEDIDCPSRGDIKGSCQMNIDNKICTYPGDIFTGGLRLRSVAYSPNSKQLASASNEYWDKIWQSDPRIKIWDKATGKLLRTLTGHKDPVISVVYSPDGKQLASCSDSIKIWDAAEGRLLRTFTETDSYVSLAYSPDGKHLASTSPCGAIFGCGDHYAVKIWDVATGKLLHKLKGSASVEDGFWSVAYSPDGKQFASGIEDGTSKIWDADTGTLLHTLKDTSKGHANPVYTVAYSPDGKQLASGSAHDVWPHVWDAATINIWDVAAGKLLRTLKGHTDSVGSVAYSHDGKQLASGSADKTIKIWDVATGKLLRTLKGHTDRVVSVAYSSDDKQLLSASRDGTIRFHDVVTGLTAPSHEIVV